MLRLHKKIVQTNIFRDIYLPISIYDRKNQIQIQHHVKKPYFQSRTSKIIKHVFFCTNVLHTFNCQFAKSRPKIQLLPICADNIFNIQNILRQTNIPSKQTLLWLLQQYVWARILLLREISCFSNDCDFPGLNRTSMAGLAGWLAGKVNMIND